MNTSVVLVVALFVLSATLTQARSPPIGINDKFASFYTSIHFVVSQRIAIAMRMDAKPKDVMPMGNAIVNVPSRA